MWLSAQRTASAKPSRHDRRPYAVATAPSPATTARHARDSEKAGVPLSSPCPCRRASACSAGQLVSRMCAASCASTPRLRNPSKNTTVLARV